MSNYLESKRDVIPPEELNDVAVQMMDFICNDFQEENIEVIDRPLNRRMSKALVDDYQVELNRFVSLGALLFGQIKFLPTENSLRDIAAGDFVFNIRTTTTPPAKSITAKVKWVPDGLNSIFEDLKDGGGNV